MARVGLVWALLFALAGCGTPAPDRAVTPRVSPADSELSAAGGLLDITHSEILLLARAQHGKKAALVNVWATWCAPCVAEMPHLVALKNRYPDDLELILVSADFDEQRSAAAAFLRELGAPEGMYFKAENDQEFIGGMPGGWTGALPAVWIFPKSGGDAIFWEGARQPEEIADAAARAIQQEQGR